MLATVIVEPWGINDSCSKHSEEAAWHVGVEVRGFKVHGMATELAETVRLTEISLPCQSAEECL